MTETVSFDNISPWALTLEQEDRDRDLADAARLAKAMLALDQLRSVVSESWVTKASREAVKAIWEKPRLGSRDSRIMWSEAAARIRLHGHSGSVFTEHVVPAVVVSARVLEAAKSRPDPAAAVLHVLQNWALLVKLDTTEPLALLTGARFARRMPTAEEIAAGQLPEGFSEALARYGLVDPNFDPNQFKRLNDWG